MVSDLISKFYIATERWNISRTLEQLKFRVLAQMDNSILDIHF